MITDRRVSLFVLVLAAVLPGVAGAEVLLKSISLSESGRQQWKLPGRLQEISGLALSPDARLFAVDDEKAVIYEIDFERGKLIKAFALGRTTIRADFEGIAYHDGLVWITTSDGRIYAAKEGADGERVSYRSWDTGLGRHCEIEGLAAEPHSDQLLLACKQLREGGSLDALSVFYWSSRSRSIVTERTLALPEKKIQKALKAKRFNPSGIVVVPHSGNILLLTSRQKALVELAADGSFLSSRNLKSSAHRQAEGIELTDDARLLIADEGGSRKARLAVYQANGESVQR